MRCFGRVERCQRAEPFHFRYVGVEAATYIMENGICLETFLSLYRDDIVPVKMG